MGRLIGWPKETITLFMQKLPVAGASDPEDTKLDKQSPSGKALQIIRAVEVAERIAGPQARDLLVQWTNGERPALLTQEARKASARMKP